MENQHQKIKGYRELNQEEIDLINESKDLAEQCGKLIERLHQAQGIDGRWLAIGRTDLQKGFMAVVRSIAKPTTF